MAYDVVIIGAGMSGLSAGIRLAYFDKKVCILEKHSRIGGLNSYYKKGGHEFDVGLHAMTNFVARRDRRKPLMRLLRQLRIGYDELDLSEQTRSSVRFNDKTLYFTNDFNTLKAEIADKFSAQIDGFIKLTDHIDSYNELDINAKTFPAREVIDKYITDRLLSDMLLCPLMFYGNAKERDMDFWQFVIMFKSIFEEGFARPFEGVRRILRILKNKYNECGGELRLGSGVKKLTTANDGSLRVVLDTGETIEAKKVISSAGYVETMRLCNSSDEPDEVPPGKMSFMESLYLLDKTPADLGIEDTIIFYNNRERFDYKNPDTLIDEKSGVICCPNNFAYDTPLKDNILRVTNIANSDLWERLSKNDDEYARAKETSMRLTRNAISQYVGDFHSSILYTDSFTPATIRRYTDHINGAVYGTEEKIRSGKTRVDNLYICGTDQGFLGIVGAMLSGITVANLYALK